MSPFFTTLSLWVGALLLVSLLSVEVHDEERSFRSIEVYFGRYLTFLTIALFQALFVTLGDIYLLRTYVVNPGWFILFALLISSIFMLIVYTLVSVFGNVGKAMAIVLRAAARRRGRNVPDPDDAALLPGIASVSAVHLRH